MVFWRRQTARLFGRLRKTRGSELPIVVKRRRWLRASITSVVAHILFVAFGLPRLLVESSTEIEVAYLPDLPPTDRPETDKEALDDKVEPEKPEKPPEPPPEPDKRLEKKPEKPPEKQPLEVVPMPDKPMVDQEEFPDEADNSKAHFLAQKNHKVDEDVQAKERTLEKPPPADSSDAPPGDPNPPSAPAAAEQRVAKIIDSPLRMREPGAEMSEEKPVEADGESRPWRPVKPGATQGAFDRLPIAPSQLTPHDYDQLVGPGIAEAERRSSALADHSNQPGHWDRLMRKQDALRASLENFVGNVKVGNQQELGTRKHPFAAFITTMHRQIHQYWGDGFLASLNSKSQEAAYPQTLVTNIEISVLADGRLDNAIIVKPSGSLPFDVAALDAVHSGAPYPPPPEVIKSADGKVYLTWPFHRDERQCHPVYVNMHILSTPPKSSPQKSPAPASPAQPPPVLEPQRLRLAQNSSNSGPLPLIPGSRPGSTSFSPALSPSSSSSSSSSSLTGRTSGGSSTNSTTASSPPTAAASNPTPANNASSKTVGGIPGGAREAAEKWLAAYAKADPRWLAGASGLPFTAGGKQVADDGSALRTFFTEMLAEGVPRRERVNYYTPTQIRGKLGHLPRGADEDDMLFAWVDLAGEDLILLLSPTDRGWSVVGLDR